MTDELPPTDDRVGAECARPEQQADDSDALPVDGADPGPVDPGVPGDGSVTLPAGLENDGLFPAPVLLAPRTGDQMIDSALEQLQESAGSGDLDAQLDAGEKVHRTLRDRLADLGGE